MQVPVLLSNWKPSGHFLSKTLAPITLFFSVIVKRNNDDLLRVDTSLAFTFKLITVQFFLITNVS